MNVYWEFLVSSLQDMLGKDLGQLVAVIFCLLLILAVAAPLFLVMRAATNLRVRRDDLLAQNPGGDSLNPVILPQSIGGELESHNDITLQRSDITLQNLALGGLASYRNMVIAIVGITVAGAFLCGLANSASGLVLLPIVLFAVAVAVVAHMTKFRLPMTSRPSTNIRQKVIMGEPIFFKLDKDALQKVRDSLSAGKDLDTVCREIEPPYANWSAIRQEVFRKALDMMLKSQQPPANPSQITVR